MKKRIILFLGFLLLGIALFVGVIISTGIDEIIGTLRHFSFLHFCIFIALSLVNYCLYAYRWQIILRCIYPKKIPFLTLFLHRKSDFALSYLTPTAQTGGAPLRILLLQNDKVPTKAATSSVIIDKGLELAALFIFQAAGIAIALSDQSLPPEIQGFAKIMFVFIIVLVFWFYYSSVRNKGVFSSVIRIFKLHKFKKIKAIEGKIMEVEEEMSNFYKKHVKIFLILIPISLVITSFFLIEHWLIARFMGVNMTFTQIFLISTLPYIAYMLPIPGGLGLLEGGHAAIVALLGIPINAFVMVFIIRIRDLAFVLVGLIHASKQGVKMLKKAFTEKKNPTL